MYKIRILCGLMIGMLLLSGCSIDKASEEDIEPWSEYLAYYVLNNEDNYTGKLIKETPAPTDVYQPDSNKGNDNTTSDNNKEPDEIQSNTGNEVSSVIGNIMYNEQFTDLLGFDGITIEYYSYEVSEIVTDGIIEIKPNKGYEYYSVYFKLINNSSKNITVDLSNKKIIYQLNVNISSSVYKASINLLNTDIRFLNTEIKTGETYIANALFSVPKDTVINELELFIEIENQSLIYKLK